MISVDFTTVNCVINKVVNIPFLYIPLYERANCHYTLYDSTMKDEMYLAITYAECNYNYIDVFGKNCSSS